MKKLLLIAMLLVSFNVMAESRLKVKTGVSVPMCKGLTASPALAVEYEYKPSWFAVGVEVQGLSPYVKEVGRLYTLTISVIPKVYYKNVYFGCKVGYTFSDMHKDGVDADDESTIGAVVGYGWRKWFVETQCMFADLDIETPVAEPLVESHSRLSNWQVLVGYKFKF